MRIRIRNAVLGIGLIGFLIFAGFLNYAYTAPSAAITTTCVAGPSGTYTVNGRMCDRVVYTLFKSGMGGFAILGIPVSTDPYFNHLLASGWKFLNFSRSGAYFSFETHNLLTNGGAGWLQFQTHASPGSTFQGSGTQTTFAVVGLGVSNSGTAPLAGDTPATGGGATAGPCQDTTLGPGEITFLGLTRTVGTYTSGTASGGSVSPQIAKTWTAYGAINGIQAGCAWAQNPWCGTCFGLGTLYAENTFTSVNLNTGDQLTVTWTFTYSG